jgi:hypothetical protein
VEGDAGLGKACGVLVSYLLRLFFGGYLLMFVFRGSLAWLAGAAGWGAWLGRRT